MRLDKFLSESTSYSRKDARKLVRVGAVTVNGAVLRLPESQVAGTDEVRINGKPVSYRKFIYLMLNKPQGYLSATEDRSDPVVASLVPEELKHFKPFPVGRLDKDTEGLLLLTNDGRFDHEMTSPKKEVRKRYAARLDIPAVPEDIEAFRAGMEFKEFTAKPALLELTDDPLLVFIEISEGKFHQVKKMCERVGKNVTQLKRVAIGALKLDESLSPGDIRELTAEELALLGYTPSVE